MKSWVYKYFGILLMMLSVIIGNYFWEDNLSNSIYSLFWIMLFVFFPGITFYNFGKSNLKSDQPIRMSFVFYFISFLMIVFSFYFRIECSESMFCGALLIFSFIFTGLGFLFLIIYFMIKRKQTLENLQNNSFRQS
jgi:hypothetical protein